MEDILEWQRKERSKIYVEGLALSKSTQRLSIITGEKVEHMVTNALGWIEKVVLLLKLFKDCSIFSGKEEERSEAKRKYEGGSLRRKEKEWNN